MTEPACAGSSYDPSHEFEPRYLAGLTASSDFGAKGGKSIQMETTAAFSTEVAGRVTRESRNLDLTNVSRQRANLKLECEF